MTLKLRGSIDHVERTEPRQSSRSTFLTTGLFHSYVYTAGEKGGLRDVKQLARSHTANRWQSQDSNPELTEAKYMLLPHPLLPWPTEGHWTKDPGEVLAL